MNCQKQWLHSTISLLVPKGQESSAAKIKSGFFVKSSEMAGLGRKRRGVDMENLTLKNPPSPVLLSAGSLHIWAAQLCYVCVSYRHYILQWQKSVWGLKTPTPLGSMWFKSNLRTAWVIVITCQLALTWCYSEFIYWWGILALTDRFICKIGIGQCCPAAQRARPGIGLYPSGCKQTRTNALQLQDEPKHDLQHQHRWSCMWIHSIPVSMQEMQRVC